MPLDDEGATAQYKRLVVYVEAVAKVATSSGGFVFPRGEHGSHILFDESEMLKYFEMIRKGLESGQAGECLKNAMSSGKLRADSSNKSIWTALLQSLKFSGLDFEHRYGILPSKGEKTEETTECWDYSFAESIVLGHTILLVPVMQQYGPMMPKLDLNGPMKKFEQSRPLLAVGMVGDCVKGAFFNRIKQQAEAGDEVAQRQKDTLLNPERLQQKMRSLVHALLVAKKEAGASGVVLDATLVGAGAFGGTAKDLAQPFADCLNGTDLPFDETHDEVNLYVFPSPKPDELTLEHLKYKVTLNDKKGLGGLPEAEAADDRVRVAVAGFDPISLAPHGVLNRAFSAEAQLCHTTDFLYRATGIPGRFVDVQVPKGHAWQNPAAFFGRPQDLTFKEDPAYKTVRFVPEPVLESFGLKNGQEVSVQLDATERVPPRVWNGDSFEGWTLSFKGVAGQTWQEIISSTDSKKDKAMKPVMQTLLFNPLTLVIGIAVLALALRQLVQ